MSESDPVAPDLIRLAVEHLESVTADSVRAHYEQAVATVARLDSEGPRGYTRPDDAHDDE